MVFSTSLLKKAFILGVTGALSSMSHLRASKYFIMCKSQFMSGEINSNFLSHIQKICL